MRRRTKELQTQEARSSQLPRLRKSKSKTLSFLRISGHLTIRASSSHLRDSREMRSLRLRSPVKTQPTMLAKRNHISRLRRSSITAGLERTQGLCSAKQRPQKGRLSRASQQPVRVIRLGNHRVLETARRSHLLWIMPGLGRTRSGQKDC